MAYATEPRIMAEKWIKVFAVSIFRIFFIYIYILFFIFSGRRVLCNQNIARLLICYVEFAAPSKIKKKTKSKQNKTKQSDDDDDVERDQSANN